MKKIIITGVFIVFLIYFSGCGLKNMDSTELNRNGDIQIVNDGNIQIETKDNLSNITWSSGFSIPVPKPDTEYIASYDYGAFCYDFDAEQLKEYFKVLESDGWGCTDETVFDKKIHYIYTKDDMILQIIDNTKTDKAISKVIEDPKNVEVTEVPAKAVEDLSVTNSYFLVNFSYGNNKIKQRVNTLSKTEVAKLIEENIEQQANTESEFTIVDGSKISMILEIFLEDSQEKMGLQAFTVLNSKGRQIGTYLICNQSVLNVFDSLKDVCVADIDQDGEWELLSLYGWGSGIYRIELSAYKYENPIYLNSYTKILHCVYRNCFVPMDGYGKFSFDKISDTEVRLLDHDWLAEESEDYTGEPEDYGRLVIDDDGIHLIPEKLEQFPYDQWDYTYDQANLSSTPEDAEVDKIKNALAEPPFINITVGEKILNYKVSKTLWNGVESTESISFTDLMENKEKLPLFDSPENGLEFKDTIALDFGDIVPDSIMVKDYLLSSSGGLMYSEKQAIDREVKIEGDGKFSFGLQRHFALMLSSNTATYENPSYRGFLIICTFGEDKVCEYAFTLGVGPMW